MENTNVTNTETMQPVKYAGFWWRVLAYLLDAFIISAVSWIIYIPVFAIMGVSFWAIFEGNVDSQSEEIIAGSFALLGFLLGSIALVAQWLYFAIMESSKTQGTLGKMALRIKVTNYEGQRITFGQATGRYFGKIVSGLILYIGFMMAGFTDKKQALHDMMANCLVIKE